MRRHVDGHALGRFAGADGRPFLGLVVGDRVRRLSDDEVVPGPAADTNVMEQWATAAPRLAEVAADMTEATSQPLDALRVLAPVEPRQVFQAGANYRTHVAQMIISGKAPNDSRSDEELRAFAEKEMDRKVRTGVPFVFVTLPSAICGPDDDVLLPPEASQVDWEAELAVVIGATMHRVPREEAMQYVAGWTLCNDVSARDLQFPPEHGILGGDWLRAKSRPTFLPTGPFFVPADQVADHTQLRITFSLNGGDLLQDDVPANMLFDVPALLESVSQAVTLLPGDIVLTGSPAGNGGHWGRWLRDGDVMEAAIEGIGAQRNRCVAEPVSG